MDEKVPCSECGKLTSEVGARQREGMCLLCSLKKIEKVPCAECGKPVAAMLVDKTNGLCLRCSAKRDPFFVLYSSLIDRVCNSDGGFSALSEPEKLYYALTLFQNEVDNGGFHQLFFNSSGAYYEFIESGLVSFDEPRKVDLLRRARRIVFPEIEIPTDTGRRRSVMPAPTPELMKELDELDQQFYRSPDGLTRKLQAFARQRGLVPADA